MIGSFVSVPVEGAQMPAYLAQPEPGSGPHPAVIVIPEIFGVNSEMQRMGDLVASAGYCALVINFFHRTDPNFSAEYNDAGIEKGREAAKNVTRATLRADVGAAIRWLDAQEFVKSGLIGTWGFCMGGAVAFVTATLPGLRGAVSFYGSQIGREFMCGEPEGLADVNDLQCPVLLVFGSTDQSMPLENIERIRTTLERAGKAFQIQVYPGVGHAFFRHGSPEAIADQRDASDEAQAQATADAWDLTRAFWKKIFSPT